MSKHPEIPREMVPWFPTINYDVCIHDQECVNFCKNDVFDWNEALGEPVVARPYNCVIGCDACSQICPSEAISFPSQAQLKATLRRLSSELSEEADRILV